MKITRNWVLNCGYLSCSLPHPFSTVGINNNGNVILRWWVGLLKKWWGRVTMGDTTIDESMLMGGTTTNESMWVWSTNYMVSGKMLES